MKVFNKKYIAAGFILLALFANISFAYSQMKCTMNMQKTCCECEAADQSEVSLSGYTDGSISKTDCCKLELKEISNTSDFQTAQNILSDSHTNFFFLPAESFSLNSVISSAALSLHQNPFRERYRDINILNSTFRI